MKRFELYLLLSLTVLYASTASTQTINVGFIERPPKIFKTADGRLRGELVPNIKNIFENARVPTSYKSFTIRQLDDFLAGKEVDAIMATKILAESGGDYLFTEEPLYYLQFYAYRLKSSQQISSLKELSETSVILTIPQERLNGEFGAWLTNSKNRITVKGVEKQLDDAWPYIKRDEASYFISYIAPKSYAFDFSRTMQSNQWAADEVFAEPMYLLLKKSVKNSEDIIARINQQLHLASLEEETD